MKIINNIKYIRNRLGDFWFNHSDSITTVVSVLLILLTALFPYSSFGMIMFSGLIYGPIILVSLVMIVSIGLM